MAMEPTSEKKSNPTINRRRGPRRNAPLTNKDDDGERPTGQTNRSHHHHQQQQRQRTKTPIDNNASLFATASSSPTTPTNRRKVLLLHGNRQTGELLRNRMRKLEKRLQHDLNLEFVAPDAPFPHPEDVQLRQWWERHDNEYRGLEKSLTMLQSIWMTAAAADENQFCGVVGFSQGARLAHLISKLATANTMFPGLQFVIQVAGYDAPLPDKFSDLLPSKSYCENPAPPLITIPSLHVWGLQDTLVLPESSQRVQRLYHNASVFEHAGGHFVPVKAPDVEVYIHFIQHVLNKNTNGSVATNGSTNHTTNHHPEHNIPSTCKHHEAEAPMENSMQAPSVAAASTSTQSSSSSQLLLAPHEETALAQYDEVEALSAIFPEEFTLLSKKLGNDKYQHPIVYQMALRPMDDDSGDVSWPPHPLTLQVRYPPTYPGQSLPELTLLHENNVFEFSSAHAAALRQAMQEAAEAEYGMPCILSCVYAAREWLAAGPAILDGHEQAETGTPEADIDDDVDEDVVVNQTGPSNVEIDPNYKKGVLFTIPPATPERNLQCTLEGLEIAHALLGRSNDGDSALADVPTDSGLGKGGSWSYTIGLVGKPSAGKSTFFNAATAFARQRDDADNQLGGATMAPHPFTTIDPNIGYCLVPAPPGSCPEDDKIENSQGQDGIKMNFGSTHGRDSQGRRLIPVMLKDVAGLVPGAYQGRGRGNKFLNDLTDADVLIHVVDASGTADTDGNTVTVEGEESRGSHPLEDLAWIRKELIEWVYTNIVFKWHTIRRRGRSRLYDMFSGYKQSQTLVWDVLLAVEKYKERTEQRDKALDKLETWDEGDLHRLVSAFLGVRFPMALALNKCDLPQAQPNIRDVQEALPVHGAHIGVPLSAQSEMLYIRYHLEAAISGSPGTSTGGTPPMGVWQCLQSAITLREPVLVFPVVDMITYGSLPSLSNSATTDASLPNKGMIACLQACGGCAPTCWDADQRCYIADSKKLGGVTLRDVVVMKPGSTVEDVFLSLKRIGALGGEFVRAEGASRIGEKAKLVPKNDLVGKHNRILKIMTNKRREWQKS